MLVVLAVFLFFQVSVFPRKRHGTTAGAVNCASHIISEDGGTLLCGTAIHILAAATFFFPFPSPALSLCRCVAVSLYAVCVATFPFATNKDPGDNLVVDYQMAPSNICLATGVFFQVGISKWLAFDVRRCRMLHIMDDAEGTHAFVSFSGQHLFLSRIYNILLMGLGARFLSRCPSISLRDNVCSRVSLNTLRPSSALTTNVGPYPRRSRSANARCRRSSGWFRRRLPRSQKCSGPAIS